MPTDLPLPVSLEVAAPQPLRLRADPVAASPGATFAAGLDRFLTAASRRSYRWAFGTLATVLLTLFALIVAHGPVLQLYYGHDDMGMLAFAWKIHNGIFPCADYHIALGPLNTWIHAAGMWLLGPTASVLPFCNGLVAVGLGCLAWSVARRRLPAFLAGAFAFTTAVVAMSPHLMRFDWYASTYDCYYNRQGFAVMMVVMLTVFLPPIRSDDRRAESRDDWMLGMIFGALLFMKITYFMAAGGLFALACLTARQPRRLLSYRLFVAFAATFVLCLPMIRFDLSAMIGDLAMAAQARSANPAARLTSEMITDWLTDAWSEIVLLAVAQGAICAPWFFRRRDRRTTAATAPSWVEFAAVIGMSVLLNATNAPGGYYSETPLATSWLFVLAGYAVRRSQDVRGEAKSWSYPRWTTAAACGLACFLWVFTYGTGLRCLCWSTWPWPSVWTQRVLAATPVFQSAPLAPLRVQGSGGEPLLPGTYAGKINDGLGLLRRLGGVHRVGALDFNNPFPFALGWPPPRGDFWAWHNGFSFGVEAHPVPAEAFGDADVLMVPKAPGERNSVAMMKYVYGKYILENFALASESEQWYLLRRR